MQFDRALMGDGIMLIVNPVFDEVEVVTNTATIQPDPMDILDPSALQSILF
jgi:hypothetical protein